MLSLEIIFILISIVLLASILVWRVAGAKKKYLLMQLESLSANTVLKKLVDNLQQHRGMINATLSGDSSFTAKINQTQKVIDSTLDELCLNLKKTELSIHLAHLNRAQQSWKNLYPTVLTLSKAESLKKHTAIVNSVLFLMTNIAEENQLLKDNSFPMELVDIIWHRIPNTAEALGKTRAAGSGVAATGMCSAIDHIKIGFLIKHIKDTMLIVEKGLNKLQNQSRDNGHLSNSYKLIQNEIHALLDTLKHKILEPSKPQITAALFFEQATVCLAMVYGFYDQGEIMINQKIVTALGETESTIKRSLSIAILSFLIMVGITILF